MTRADKALIKAEKELTNRIIHNLSCLNKLGHFNYNNAIADIKNTCEMCNDIIRDQPC